MKTVLLWPRPSKVAFRIDTIVAGINAKLIIRTIGMESTKLVKNLSIIYGKAMNAATAAATDTMSPSIFIVLLFCPLDSSGSK